MEEVRALHLPVPKAPLSVHEHRICVAQGPPHYPGKGAPFGEPKNNLLLACHPGIGLGSLGLGEEAKSEWMDILLSKKMAFAPASTPHPQP